MATKPSLDVDLIMLTLYELKDKLLQTKDPDDLLELLNISSEELLDRFEDKLDDETTRRRLCEEFEEEKDED